MADKKLILISNDDGIAAPGLKVLIDCVADLGDIYVVAPDKGQSGQSAAITVNAPLRITAHPDYNGAKMFSVNGTPVDCVKLAMHAVLPGKPDVMVCGVNHGSNAGSNVVFSGTMGAVFESCMHDIPSVGFSLLDHSMSADFSHCEPLIKDITRKVIAAGLPEGICLNVNFPADVAIEGVKVVRAAKSCWSEEYRKYEDPHGKSFYWLTGKMIDLEKGNHETDLYWLDQNYATVVPTCSDRSEPSAMTFVESMLK